MYTHIIRKHGSLLCSGMAKEIFKFTIVLYYQDNGQRSYKPQIKHAERMILPSSSQKNSRTYLWVRGSWETDRKRSWISSSSFFFFLSHSYKTLDEHILQTKAVIELLHAQYDIVFIVVAPFIQFVCKLARVAVLASCSSLKSSNTMPFLTQKKVEVQMCTYFPCAVHIQGGLQPLGISTNLFLFVSTMTVPSWRHGFLFMMCRACILRTLLWGCLAAQKLWETLVYIHGNGVLNLSSNDRSA